MLSIRQATVQRDSPVGRPVAYTSRPRLNNTLSSTLLRPEWYHFKRCIVGGEEGRGHLEQNLLPVILWILASWLRLLTAAKINTQVEFDHSSRSILREESNRNKRILFIAGLNIDIFPDPGQLFPLTRFAPWAAYIQESTDEHRIFEQDKLFSRLKAARG